MDRIKDYLFGKFQEGILFAAVICPVASDFWNTEVFNLPVENRAELAAQINPAALDSQRREKLAEILGDGKKVYLELPETRAAAKLSFDLTDNEKLQRARILTQWNRNQLVLDTLQNVSGCEATYLRGLALRRLRKYADARATLWMATETCESDFQKKAFFLLARLAAMNPTDDNLKVINEFLKKYPHDSLTDDVLLWKAHALLELGKEVAALQTLNRILNDYPQSDMRGQALFERAFEYARAGQTSLALNLLAGLKTSQGTYWRGRLKLHPNLNNLDLNPNEKERLEGQQILREQAGQMPHNYYGYMASQLVQTRAKAVAPKTNFQSSTLLEADPTYKIMQCFQKNAQNQEAVWVADRLARSYRSETERRVLAQEYIKLNRPDKAHQMMRDLGLAFPKADDSNYPWHLAFPNAYPEAFSKASKRENMPIDWLMGLSREESQFDKDVISWAGAVGLCQLLPQTARRSEAELLDPETNIDIAAKHLRELWNDLKHPFKAIAAYNGGASAVKRWSKERANIPMDTFVELIPYEQTRNYVKKVTSAWLSYAWLGGRIEQVDLKL